MRPEFEIAELTSASEWSEAYSCLAALRPKLTLEEFLDRRESLISRQYHLLGLRDAGRLVCAAGYLLHPHIERGSELWLHDLATLPEERSRGYGKALIAWLERIAAEHGCSRIMVHTRLQRDRAIGFYTKKCGFLEYALVLEKRLPTLPFD